MVEILQFRADSQKAKSCMAYVTFNCTVFFYSIANTTYITKKVNFQVDKSQLGSIICNVSQLTNFLGKVAHY